MSEKTFEFDDHVASQLKKLFQTEVLKKLREEYFSFFDVSEGSRVLDIGCGTGANAVALLEFLKGRCQVTGVDTSDSMLAIARHHLEGSPFENNIHYELADAHTLPFEENSFDSAMMIQVLEYSKDPILMLQEAMRVLKAGGKLFVADTDWDTIVWNSSFKDLTRRIVVLWSDHEADGWQGRKIREYMLRAGFQSLKEDLFHISEHSFSEDSYTFLCTKLIADYLIRSEKMAEAEITEWLDDLRAKDSAGHSYFSLNRYAYLGQKPA
jgi:arsenite methyltransferase